LLLIVSGSNEITLDEIGEINDHIQTEAGFNNIIMGVGEDETLVMQLQLLLQQVLISNNKTESNTEPKKIIHTLEDEQRSVHNLSNTTVPAFDLNKDSAFK
jgi:cell division protein FtsZ